MCTTKHPSVSKQQRNHRSPLPALLPILDSKFKFRVRSVILPDLFSDCVEVDINDVCNACISGLCCSSFTVDKFRMTKEHFCFCYYLSFLNPKIIQTLRILSKRC